MRRNKIVPNGLTESLKKCIFNVYTRRLGMVTKIQKWGNSLGLRIPRSFAKEAAIEEGSSVDISLEGDRLVIRPVHTARYKLSELLSQVTEDNLHEEIVTGDAVGREAW
jgi:antitoxin MazE